MATTIRTLRLEVESFSVEVALRGASEARDVTLGRALPVYGEPEADGEGNEVKPVIGYVPISRIDIEQPDEDVEEFTWDIKREKGKVIQAQYDGEVARGVWEGSEFYAISDEEIEQIDSLTKIDTLTIQEFIPAEDVPWERAQASYYLAPPKGAGAKHLVTIRNAMQERRVVGVAKLMPKSRQKLAIIYPKHGGLMVTCLAYSDTFEQVRAGAAEIESAEPSPVALDLMKTLIDLKMAPVEVLDEYSDDQIVLRADYIERAKLGHKIVQPESPVLEAPAPAGVDALMDGLKASIERISKERKKAPAAKRGKAKASAQKTPAAPKTSTARRRQTAKKS